MCFDPVSSRKNFVTVKDASYLKPQIEEMFATETNGFSEEIETEIQKIEWCDLMIWQFPLWWFGMPAVLKGWVDRVLAMGRAYGGGRIYESGVFRGKRALLSLTTGGPEAAYTKGAFNGDMAGILRPIQRGMLQFVGFDVLAPQIVYGPVRLTDEQRRQQLTAYAERLRGIGNESPIDVGIY
jgi:NAD(P)H dehydrogenase (quinone)